MGSLSYYIKENKIKLEVDIIREINFLFLCISNKDIFDKCVEIITSMEIVSNISDDATYIDFKERYNILIKTLRISENDYSYKKWKTILIK